MFNLLNNQTVSPKPSFTTIETIKKLAQSTRYIQTKQRLQKQRFVVMDTETTGFNPENKDEIISIGAVVIENGQIKEHERFHRFVNPYRQIPEEVTRLTGITEDMVCKEKSIFAVLAEVLPFIGNSIIVGHHIGFDLSFINLKLKKYCRTRLYNPTCDTMILGSAFYPEMRAHTLNRLLLKHGLEPVNRHTAIGDARLTAKLFIVFLQILKEYNIFTYKELVSFVRQKSYLNQKISF